MIGYRWPCTYTESDEIRNKTVTSTAVNSTTVLKIMDNLATVLSAVGGTVLVLLVTTISISLLVLCYRRGILSWLTLPPKQGTKVDKWLFCV